MLLKNLLPNNSISNAQISAIEMDSRLVKSGAMFFALKGGSVDGVKFVDSALENGAAVVVCAADADLSLLKNAANPAIIKVENPYQVLIFALQKFYSHLPENILAVTGTNGKTSVAYFIQQMQEILGKKSASIGTLGIKISDDNFAIKKQLTEFALTTPDIISLYKNLAVLKAGGVDDVAIEASSIGLEQKRLAGIKIGLGSFTNFTQDHLDYHGSMDQYFDCKMLLFKDVLQPNSIALLNADIAEFEKIKQISLENKLQVFAYSANGSNHADCKIAEENNQTIIEIFGKKYPAKINVFGDNVADFQKANILCALLSVVSHYHLDFAQIEFLISNLDKIKSAEGRMQLVVTLKNNAKIFIDYAHTPDALQNVLQTAAKIPHQNLYVLFGCGGDRDKSKRPQMGKIASDLADFVIVSDDNPRTENAEQIRKEILSACDLSKTTQIENRKNAIEQTIARLDANDILIIAGKGHEKYQIIGKEKFEFDEKGIVQEAINSKE